MLVEIIGICLIIFIMLLNLLFVQPIFAPNCPTGCIKSSVKTENRVYFSNDPIKVSGSVFNASGFPVKNGTVTIKVYPVNSTQAVYDTSVSMRKGYFTTSELRLAGDDSNGIFQLIFEGWGSMSKLFSHRYNLTATALVDGKPESTAWTQLEIKGYFTTPSGIYLGLIILF
jgi:hypothetical protein